MKKILFVAPSLNPGGAENVIVKTINNLNTEKYEIKIVLVNKIGNLIKEIEPEIEIIDLGSSKAIFSIVKLYNVIKKEKPDIIFSIIGHLNIILSILKTLVFRSDDITFIGRENAVYDEAAKENSFIKRTILDIMNKKFMKKLDVIIVQSEFMKQQVIDFFNVPFNKVIILNNPIEPDKIMRLKKDRIKNPEWKLNKINLIAVGRLEKVKNYQSMIEIMKLLPENYHLNIFGEGSEREELMIYINKMNLKSKVTLHGFISNPYKYMNQSSILLMTSTRETFPNVVLEANACGLYVVSYDIPGGINEIIQENINGSIVEYGNLNKAAEKILDITNKDYDKDKIVMTTKKYNIKNYIKNLEGIFERKQEAEKIYLEEH